MDSEDKARCGGEGCDGLVMAASSTLRKAQDSEQEIISALEEVEKLSKMVSVPGLGLSWPALALIQDDVLTCVFVFRCWRPR